MKIASFDIYKYNLKFNQPVNVKGQPLNARQGLIIHLKSDDGSESFGEMAPLPGFSREQFVDALDQAKILKSKLVDSTIPEHLTKFKGKFNDWFDAFDLKPSVRFGIESAVLQLIAAAKNVPLYKVIPNTIQHKIRISGLLTGERDEIINQAKAMIDQGYTELKVKVGDNIIDDIGKIKALKDVTYGKVLVHLDANQKWNIDQAVEFGNAIGCDAVSYIEEPLDDITKIPEFYDKTLIPVALDESVQTLSLEEIRSISGVETIILKPTMLGGVERILQMLTQAENYALDTVISSSLESSIGIYTLANIVEASTHNTAAGLDTLKWFEDDVLKIPVAIEHGAINIDKLRITSDNINFDVLEKL